MSNARGFLLQRAEARQITAPVAICSPAQVARRARSTLLKFTVAEGAEYHCKPMAAQLRDERVLDWLETNAPI